MADKHVAEAGIEDVSDRCAADPSERVFRSASGYFVRVTTLRLPSDDPTRLHFQVTGALVREEDARVIVRNGVPLVGAPHTLTVHAESQVDVAGEVQKARELVVRRMELAAIHHAQDAALEGVA